ncbi:MAG TPA: cysteine synthase family protein [Puia sp.]|nr:cysteine synthase family protein [Puia sp.]
MNDLYLDKQVIKQEDVFRSLWHLVGNTPMLELQFTDASGPGRIYVKCEHYNLTGSIKDRMALYILHQAYRRGEIRAGDLIIEATSGNTGIAFAAIGKALGHPVRIIMPDWLSRERMDIIRSLGAEVLTVSKAEGGFLRSIRMSEEMAATGGVFLPRQFDNTANSAAHRHTTGPEILGQLAAVGKTVDAFVAGVGTGGTVMGVGEYLRGANSGVHAGAHTGAHTGAHAGAHARPHSTVRIHPVEPAESPTLTTGHKVGSHRIQGISDEFIPSIVRLDSLDAILAVHDGDAILMAQKLSHQLGLAVGISAGANVIGAIRVARELGPEAVVVTVLPDSNKKYLSTDLVREEPMRSDYISANTGFTGYLPIPRLATAIVPAAGDGTR